MDPVAHTFTGATMFAAGLRRATPLAAAALIMGANAPDVDVLAYFAAPFEAIAFRRGWTHGLLALAIWPFLIAAVLLAWDRWVRRRRNPAAAPARAGPLLAVTALAVATHPLLDWLNDYGVRWLMPFDRSWYYGDALVVVDPWVWLVLGGVLFLTYSSSRLAIARWTVFWVVTTFIVLAAGALVPFQTQILWLVGVAALAAARVRRPEIVRNERTLERAALAVLALFAVYIVATSVATRIARSQVRDGLAALGIHGVERVMVGPAAGNPFAGEVVAATADTYYLGHWRWLAPTRLNLDGDPLPRPRGAVYDAAASAPEARKFLTWSRFPVIDTEPVAGGAVVVHFADARYVGRRGIDGPTVRLDSDLHVTAAD
ncbi:MAG TPA: metal-dependent hydrolase [Gammaproteobacteria bacterium]|nr:metal-dependent hydrolase [Gammaproteobacteria bacterium]